MRMVSGPILAWHPQVGFSQYSRCAFGVPDVLVEGLYDKSSGQRRVIGTTTEAGNSPGAKDRKTTIGTLLFINFALLN